MLSYEGIDAMRRANGKFQVMDYNTQLDACDEMMRVEVPGLDELERAYEMVRSFGLPDALAKAQRWMQGNNSRVIPTACDFCLSVAGETIVDVVCDTP